MIRKKLLKNVSKKMMAILLSISMLFSNLMPLSTVFALENGDKANMVQINIGQYENIEDIDIDGNTATIHYTLGTVTVSGNDLSTEEIEHEYEDHPGYMHVLYTTSTNLVFDADPNPGNKVFCWYEGHLWENHDENFEFNDLETFSVRHREYQIDFDFRNVNEPDPDDYIAREPTGATYQIDFGSNSWEIDGRTVYASIAGKDLLNGPVEVSDYDTIEMHNYDGGMMDIILRGEPGEHQFSIGLFTNGKNETNLTFIKGDGILPGEDVLTFEVVPRENHGPNNNDTYHIDFGEAAWYFDDGETVVTATVEGKDLTQGYVDLAGDEEIVLTNFDPSRMQVRAMVVQDRFTFLMNVGGDGKFTPHSTPADVQLPNDLDILIYVENLGDEPDPNPPQEGEHTATVCVSGVEGSFIYRYYDEEEGKDVEVEIPYGGPGESAAMAGTRFSINRGAVYQFRPNGEVYEEIQGEERYICTAIEYKYDDLEGEDPNYIKLWLGTPFEAMFSNKITVNDEDYTVSDYLDYTDRNQWLGGIDNSGNVGFELEVPKDPNDIYKVVVQVDPSEYYYLGRYEWTNEEHDSEWPSYIGHSSIDIVSVKFEYDGDFYEYTEDRFNEDFDDFLIHYEIDPNPNNSRGMLIAPDNAEITARIIPEYGYQITDVTATGGYTTDDIGEYIFTIPKSEEDFQVEVTPEDDTFFVDHPSISSASIDFGNNHFPAGTANTEITDVSLTPEEIENFETYAGNYQIKQIFNVMVEAVLYRGSSAATWREELEGLDRYTQVTVQFSESIVGDEVVILHQTGNNQFETLRNVTFDSQNNTITFKTMKYGNFAIATHDLTPIASVDVMLDQPEAGVTVMVTQGNDPETNEPYFIGDPAPSVAAAQENMPYFIDDTAWVRGTCRDGSGTCREYFNGTFDINGDNYARISVSANDGYKFTYETLDHITVNGHELDTDNDEAIVGFAIDGSNIMFVTRIKTAGSNENPPVKKGDFNGNDKIDLLDIITLLRRYLNGDATDEEKTIGDMDGDGNLGLKDVITLLRSYLNGE